MPINQSLLPEFDHEMGTTRKLLERVADDTFAFKPHPKSGSMGWLATHIARLPTWTTVAIDQDELDLAAGEPPKPPPTTNAALLAEFDQNVKEARAAIASVPDDVLFKPWSLKRGPMILMTLPKVGILRGFVMNHLIHHRGQLSVYLRLNDIPVPAIYGPSADENSF